MEYNIEVKNVAPLMVLTHHGKCSGADIKRIAYELHATANLNEKESLFCLTEVPYLDDSVKVKVCCPIRSVDVKFDKNVHTIEVLPRSLMLSTIHLGEYNDLKDVFKGMNEYIEKNNLHTALPYRMIYHREKRENVRPDVHRKPENEYVTEIQIPLLDQ